MQFLYANIYFKAVKLADFQFFPCKNIFLRDHHLHIHTGCSAKAYPYSADVFATLYSYIEKI